MAHSRSPGSLTNLQFTHPAPPGLAFLVVSQTMHLATLTGFSAYRHTEHAQESRPTSRGRPLSSRGVSLPHCLEPTCEAERPELEPRPTIRSEEEDEDESPARLSGGRPDADNPRPR